MQAKSVLPGGCTKGELTVPGQLQSRELGQYLRQRYIQDLQFLSPQYQARHNTALQLRAEMHGSLEAGPCIVMHTVATIALLVISWEAEQDHKSLHMSRTAVKHFTVRKSRITRSALLLRVENVLRMYYRDNPSQLGISGAVVVLQDTEVEARSTNYRRTIATLQGLLTGLWPDASSAVPMRVAQDVDEVMFGRADSCERLKDLMKQQAKALKGTPDLAGLKS